MLSTKLLVKNLPEEFSDADKNDFLKLFGGCEVTAFSSYGKMRNCCFVSFPDVITAKQALETLHQFEILNKRLTVEYAKSAHEKESNNLQAKNTLEKKEAKAKEEEKSANEKETHLREEITEICPKLNVNHAFPSHLTYKYPDPTINTLTNIANALATIPKFYVQVLHLMNKMNLPAPFGEPTPTPPVAGCKVAKVDQFTDTFDLHECRSSDESELESDSDDRKPGIYQSNNVIEPVRKRKRLKALNKVNQEKFRIVPLKKAESVESAFELASKSKVDNTLASRIKDIVEQRKIEPPVHFSVFDERGDFGKIEPLKKEEIPEAKMEDANKEESEEDENEEEEEESEDELNREYITANELRENRISDTEILTMTQFKNYDIGTKTNRLYIKNLSKQVTEDELKFIFTRFIRKNSTDKNASLDIRLMQEGRMKGQAFVTFPSEDIAEKALTDTHGYVLHEKPMVIQFGRAGK